MTGKERRQLNDNRGFSLVELLIAVVILAIIVIPLMRLFVSSTSINVKSRNTLRATTVAQDIMEGLKAYNIEELKDQFNNPTDGFYVTDSRLVKGTIQEETGLEVDGAGNHEDGIYCFSMAGVKLQGSVYDALIRVDGRGYMEGTTIHDNEFNSKNISKIGGVRESGDKGSDGLYDETAEFKNKTILEKMYDQWKTELNAGGIMQAADLSYKTPGLMFNRKYIVDIADSGRTDKDGNIIAEVTVSVEIDGTYDGVSKTFYVLDHVPCANYAGGNLYFFYYPLYDAMDDEIEINNPDHLPLSMSIIKQIEQNAGVPVLTDTQLMAAEKKYHVSVNFIGCDKDQLKLRTNLGTSLVSEAYLLAGGESPSLPGQAKFRINGAERLDLNIYDLSGIRNTILGAAGTDDEVTEFIYDVEVMIYRDGAATNGFPDDDRMVTIRGSINN